MAQRVLRTSRASQTFGVCSTARKRRAVGECYASLWREGKGPDLEGPPFSDQMYIYIYIYAGNGVAGRQKLEHCPQADIAVPKGTSPLRDPVGDRLARAASGWGQNAVYPSWFASKARPSVTNCVQPRGWGIAPQKPHFSVISTGTRPQLSGKGGRDGHGEYASWTQTAPLVKVITTDRPPFVPHGA